MLKKWYQVILGREFELRERMFRISILVGEAAVLAGIIECIVIMNNPQILIPLFILFAVMSFALVATFKYRKVEISAIAIGLLIATAIFPTMFFFSGGIEGGATVWFVFSMFYIFMMFSGKKRVFFVILSLISDVITYLVAYYYPEAVTPLDSREAIFMDSLFSVIAVGIVGGLIIRFQMRIFEMERAVSLEQKDKLEKVSSTKNTFFANMSHEIRTPINTIIGLNEMILRENESDATREYAENIKIASKMLLNLVNDILDLSQIEMKKMEIVPAEYQTTELFGELVDMIQIRTKEKRLEFLVDIDENLPSVLYGDEKRIQQVLLNILTNAVKYTNSGSVTFAARAEAVKDEAISLKVTVSDTGVGIRKEDLEYIYDSFRRIAEKKNSKIEGSGLGLSISKQLIDMMGGEITVDSIYTKGSVFTVILDQKVIDATPIGNVKFLEQEKMRDGEAYKQSFEAPEARVLVVDDNKMNRYVIEKLLGATKVQLDMAESGAECLEMTRQKYYHVILMDYMMPEMDGAETLRLLRRQENGLCRESAVVLLSADSQGDTRQLYLEHRFDGYLEKPIQGAALEAEILQFLPEDIVEYRADAGSFVKSENEIRRISGRKRKNIYITSDCICELPEELLEKYDIKLIYFYIKTDYGRFADTKEMDSDNLSQYVSQEGSIAYADSVSVEEYEEFFAGVLTQAEHVIHISVAEHAGKSYEIAVAAARGFDHVHIIDSGQISCGQGLVTLYAAKLAAEGYHTTEICQMIEKLKANVEAKYMMPTAQVFYQHGYTNKLMARICSMFQLHPVLIMRQSRMFIIGVRAGKLEGAWKRFIRFHLWNKRKIDTGVVFITHVGCSVRQLELIKQEILRHVPFEEVLVEKASVSNACNSGMETIGIAYYSKV